MAAKASTAGRIEQLRVVAAAMRGSSFAARYRRPVTEPGRAHCRATSPSSSPPSPGEVRMRRRDYLGAEAGSLERVGLGRRNPGGKYDVIQVAADAFGDALAGSLKEAMTAHAEVPSAYQQRELGRRLRLS